MARQLLIAGGGVIGLCAAYYAIQKGQRVTIVERGAPGHDSCSLGNAGMVVPSHFAPLAAPGAIALALKWIWNPESPFYIRSRLNRDLLDWGWKFMRAANAGHVARSAPLLRDLHMASRSCFEQLAEKHGNEFGLVRKGLLMLCRTQRALDEEAATAEQARRLGIPAEVLDPGQTASMDPGMRMDIVGAVHFPKDCHLSPQRFMNCLTRELTQAGVEFSWNTEVRGWHTRGTRIEAIRTSQGDISADEFVLACGSWSPVTAHDLQLQLPMQAGKGYSLTLLKPRQLPALCSICTEARIAVTPMGSSLRFGGTMEITGLDESISMPRVRGIIKAIPQYFPDFSPDDFDGIPPWLGLRPCSPDGMPYLGRTGCYANLIIATGHAMMGMSLGPITGKLVAEMATGEPPSINISLLNPDRYASSIL
jgi:D-amino-acid dehydrogenase